MTIPTSHIFVYYLTKECYISHNTDNRLNDVGINTFEQNNATYQTMPTIDHSKKATHYFDPIQTILGPSGITLGHILQAAFEDMGGYFFDFDLIKTILGIPGTTLRHLTEYVWTF